MLFTNLTGKKEVKGFNEEVVIVCPTAGEFRITPLVAAKLQLADGDSALLVQNPNNPSQIFLAKGKTGVEVLDENGQAIKDGRGRHSYEENTQFGATVRTASPGSALLKVTASVAWTAVGGDENKNKFYSLGEAIEGGVPTGNEDEIHTTMFYPLVFKSEKAKAARKASAEGEVNADEDFDASSDADFEEEEI